MAKYLVTLISFFMLQCAPNWDVFKASKCGYELMLPEKPLGKVIDEDPLIRHSFSIDRKTHSYQFGCMDGLPQKNAGMTLKQYYRIFLNGFGKSFNGVIVEESFITLAGHKGYQAKMKGNKDNLSFVVIIRIISTPKKFHYISYWAADDKKSKDADRFFNSFKKSTGHEVEF